MPSLIKSKTIFYAASALTAAGACFAAGAAAGAGLAQAAAQAAVAGLAGLIAPLLYDRLLVARPSERLAAGMRRIHGERDLRPVAEGRPAATGAVTDLAGELGKLTDFVRGFIDTIKTDLNSGIETTELLAMNAEFGQSRTAEVDDFLRRVRAEFGVLAEAVDKVEKAFGGVAERVVALDAGIGTQARIIDEDAKAVGDLIGRLRQSAELARAKRAAMDGLAAVVSNGGAKLANTTALVRTIERDAGRMLELIASIDSIAEGTNTLSINASIQAVQAGEAGKGFVVVAKEVRKLAEKARENSADIAATLGGTIRTIRQAADASKDIELAFEAIRKETASVGEAFATIDGTLGSLAAEGDRSLALVGQVRDGSEAMRRDYAAITGQAEAARVAILDMKSTHATLSDDTAEIEKNVRDLTSINGALSELSRTNRERIGHVTRTVMDYRTWAGTVRLRLPTEPNGAHAYYHELLRTALERIGMKCEFELSEPLPQNEIISRVGSGKLDLYWLIQTPERDRSLVPVEVVLSHGLVGKRVLFIPKGSQKLFDGVQGLRDFRRLGLKGGFGAGWFDVKVWRGNGLEAVEQDGDWRTLFDRVARRDGVDYLSRGANEIVMEAPLHPELDIERRLLFVYIRNLRYYLAREAAHYRPVIENAIREAVYSGLMDELMRKYYPQVFDPRGLNLEGRTQIRLVV